MRAKEKPPVPDQGSDGLKPAYISESNLTKFSQQNPPLLIKRYDQVILEKLAREHRGSLVGDLAAKRLEALCATDVGGDS